MVEIFYLQAVEPDPIVTKDLLTQEYVFDSELHLLQGQEASGQAGQMPDFLSHYQYC